VTNVVGAFPGTQYELNLLRAAVGQNCTCGAHQPPAATDAPCPAHDLLRSPRVLTHLIFVYRTRAAYTHSEWNLEEAR
jgi:hypothetical protein